MRFNNVVVLERWFIEGEVGWVHVALTWREGELKPSQQLFRGVVSFKLPYGLVDIIDACITSGTLCRLSF